MTWLMYTSHHTDASTHIQEWDQLYHILTESIWILSGWCNGLDRISKDLTELRTLELSLHKVYLLSFMQVSGIYYSACCILLIWQVYVVTFSSEFNHFFVGSRIKGRGQELATIGWHIKILPIWWVSNYISNVSSFQNNVNLGLFNSFSDVIQQIWTALDQKSIKSLRYQTDLVSPTNLVTAVAKFDPERELTDNILIPGRHCFTPTWFSCPVCCRQLMVFIFNKISFIDWNFKDRNHVT